MSQPFLVLARKGNSVTDLAGLRFTKKIVRNLLR